MLRVYILVKYFPTELFIILILLAKRNQCNTCRPIETLSFGSDIEIKCNQTYLTFIQRSSNIYYWEFKNESIHCRQQGILQAHVNECSLKQINSNYLSVPLKSNPLRELGCIYCFLNYKPIEAIIQVTQSNEYDYDIYTFSITAIGLDVNESFEIIWAKRTHIYHRHSVNYWFYQTCYFEDIELVERTSRSIVFTVADTNIERVEFIIRRCQTTCLIMQPCSHETIGIESNKNYFRTPEALQKIVCDENCLKGLLPSTTTTTTSTTTNTTTNTTTMMTMTITSTQTTTTMSISTNRIKKATLFSSTIQLSHQKQTIKSLIFYPLTGLLIVLLLILLACLIICRLKGSRSDNTYKKTSNINLDDNKETIE